MSLSLIIIIIIIIIINIIIIIIIIIIILHLLQTTDLYLIQDNVWGYYGEWRSHRLQAQQQMHLQNVNSIHEKWHLAHAAEITFVFY